MMKVCEKCLFFNDNICNCPDYMVCVKSTNVINWDNLYGFLRIREPYKHSCSSWKGEENVTN